MAPLQNLPGHVTDTKQVKSFGFGGANAHAILESGDPIDQELRGVEHVESSERWTCLLPVSGKSTTSIQATILALCNMDLTNITVLHLARQVELAKSSLPPRSFCLTSSNAIIPSSTNVMPEPHPKQERKIVFLFSDQGAH